MKNTILHSLLTLLLLVFCLPDANAQGFRYGTLQYRILDSNDTHFNVEFRFYQEWDETASYFLNGGNGVSVGDVDTLANFFFGDGGVIDLPMPVSAIEDGVIKGTSIFTHSYNKGKLGDTSFVADVLATPRTNILSTSNANGFYRIRTTVIEQGAGYDSPAINVAPVTVLGVGNVGTFDLFTAIDEDATGDSYSIPVDQESGLFGGNTQPSFVTSVDANTGIVSYDATGALPGFYPFQVKINDDLGGTAVVDFIIEISNCTTAPSFVAPSPADNTVYTIPAGTNVSFTIAGQLGDATHDDLTLTPTPLPNGATLSALSLSGSTYSATFSWTPTIAQLGNFVLAFTLRDEDNNTLVCLDNTRTYEINVNQCNPNYSGTPNYEYVQPATFSTNYPNENASCFYPGITSGVTLSPNVVNGSGNYSYIWSDNTTNASIYVTSVSQGGDTYSVQVIDNNEPECTTTVVFNLLPCQLTSVPLCDATISVSNCTNYGDPMTFYNGYSKGFDLTAIADGDPEYDYLWSTGDTTQNIFVLPTAATDYWVEITDSNGCVSSDTVSISYVDLTAGCWTCTPTLTNNNGNGHGHGGGNCGNHGWNNGNNNCSHTNCSRRTCNCNNSCNNHACHHKKKKCGKWWCNNNHNFNCNRGNCGNPPAPTGKKMTICHIPPGNPSNAHTITISQNAWPAHAAHGDVQGSCDGTYGNCENVKYNRNCRVLMCKTYGWGCWNGSMTVSVPARYVDYYLSCGNYTLGPCTTNKTEQVYDLLFDMNVMPNPSTDGRFTLSYQLFEKTDVKMEIVDYTGRVVHSVPLYGADAGMFNEEIDLSTQPAGLYVVTITAYGETWSEKVQVIK